MELNKTFKCELQLTNMSEWIQHIYNISQQKEDTKEALERACDFDFKFDVILQS